MRYLIDLNKDDDRAEKFKKLINYNLKKLGQKAEVKIKPDRIILSKIENKNLLERILKEAHIDTYIRGIE
jgi:hypothetical protein